MAEAADREGILAERVRLLKHERGYAKGNVTRKCSLIKDLMKDKENAIVVTEKLASLEDTVQDFIYAHRKYHELLTDLADIQDSHVYYSSMMQDLQNFKEEVSQWSVVATTLHGAEKVIAAGAQAVQDNITSVSQHSRTSSINSAKAKLAAKRASLLAEASTLQKRQELEFQELRLQQQKRELDVHVELVKAEAEEKAYSDFELAVTEPNIHNVMHDHHTIDGDNVLSGRKRNYINSWRTNVAEQSSRSDTHHIFQPIEVNASVNVHPGSDSVVQQVDLNAHKVFVASNDEMKIQSDPFRPVNVSHAHDKQDTQNTMPVSSKLNPNVVEWNDLRAHRQRDVIDEPCKSVSATSEQLLHLIYQGQQQQQQLVDAIQLPKTELQTFDGNPLQYWSFIRSFENSVERQSVDSNAKLTRLIQYCTGKARTVIQSCSVIEPEVGYVKAKQLLKDRFGNDYTIAEAWIRKVTEGNSLRASDREALLDFSDELMNCTETLSAMHHLSELDNQRSLLMIIRKLPLYLQNRWKKEAHKLSKKFGRCHIQDVVKFVKEAAEEANDPVFGALTDTQIDRSHSISKGKGLSRNTYDKKKSFSFNTHCCDNKISTVNSVDACITKTVKVCPLCKCDHTLFGCEEFKKLSPEERLKFVYEKKLCVNCLQAGHFAYRCVRETTCSVAGCGRKHTRFLHQPKFRSDLVGRPDYNSSNKVKPESGVSDDKPRSFDEARCSRTGVGTGLCKSGRIALPIVPVKVYSSSGGNFVQTHALLDSGSTNTFCSMELIQMLGVQGKHEELSLTTLDKEKNTVDTVVVSLVVSDQAEHNFVKLPNVFSRPMLPFDTDNWVKPEDLDRWPHLQHLNIPRVDMQKVTLLIGQDVPDALLPLDVRKGPAGSPYATQTLLGWSINGPIAMGDSHKAVNSFIQADHGLTKQVETFWKLEASELLSDYNTASSVNDRRAVAIWDKSIIKKDGHYEMGIPFKNKPPSMPNNRNVAAQRLHLLSKRLQKDSALCQKYCAGIEDLLNKGYAERIPDNEVDRNDGAVWYLPHHPVLHDKKPDKVRIVFDCSAKYAGSSLNDQVLKGPDLMNNLVGVLLRFREDYVAVMSDVEAMFHQVKVPHDDCDVLRFLWWPNGDLTKDPEEHRMVVHLFGGIWSPSSTSYALLRTADDNKGEFDIDIVEAVHRNFYVDDFLKSVKTEQEGIRLSNEMCHILARGGFRLTKWVSNSRNVMEHIPPEERAKDFKSLDLKYEILPSERALGMKWNVERDKLGYTISVKDKPLTKRGVLSIVSSLFDPLGFLSPFVLSAKMILQELCRKKVGWDDNLPEKELTQWLKWLKDIPKMEEFVVDRCIKPAGFGQIKSYQLHHFADACLTGYGVVTYLRIVDAEDHVHCSFVLGKCRLAPIKQVTIPRLELSAATLAVKLDRMLHQEMDVTLQDSVFWTDSTLVLQYIENEDKRFQTFVANRITVIHDCTSPTQWHYVDTLSNPADDASRSLTADQMLSKTRWLQGPNFLWQDESHWPQRPSVEDEIIPHSEIRKETCIYTVVASESDDMMSRLFDHYSSWYELKKSVAWILKVKQKLLDRIRTTSIGDNQNTLSLSVVDLRYAEEEIVKYVQRQYFKDEISTLNRQQPTCVKKSSSLIHLEPNMSASGILCVGGRLTHAPISTEAKYQMILPKDHHIVKLIILHYHEVAGHSGREHVLALIRQKFWIVKGRAAVKSVLNDCFHCRRRMASRGVQQMADLPKDRVTPNDPPFTYVGVDYFGPIMVKRGRSEVKRYGCVFTCLAIRAIHIEVAHSMDTSSFINALQRFISRRGQPTVIRSDNGTNFVGGNKELRSAIAEWNQNKIENFLKQRAITWKFNPPGGSHMGGIWERQIRTIRKVMSSVLKQQALDDEGLSTLMCQVEAIVNSRPITIVSGDARDNEPLTPNHLLLLRSGPQLPPGIFVHEDMYSRRRWKQVQYLANIFWRRWLKEYLPNLQERQKWLTPRRNISIGDIVLVVDENVPRNLWPLGRVTDTYPGRDGLVRIVQVKTRSSSFVRPIDKLCLLENV